MSDPALINSLRTLSRQFEQMDRTNQRVAKALEEIVGHLRLEHLENLIEQSRAADRAAEAATTNQPQEIVIDQ